MDLLLLRVTATAQYNIINNKKINASFFTGAQAQVFSLDPFVQDQDALAMGASPPDLIFSYFAILHEVKLELRFERMS